MTQATHIDHLKQYDPQELRPHLAECPPPADGTPVEQIIDEAIDWVTSLQRDIIALVSGIDTPDDIDMAVAVQYVELKSRWIAFNTKMNYELFRSVNPDPRDMCRAAAVSNFLAHVEQLLKTEDIDRITEFLAQPINEAA